jgi:zinc D-Ala-D-Ala carboxypeptidase
MPDTNWPHFSQSELACHCGCGQFDMDAVFMERLELLRVAFGQPMPITSAIRCPNHNAQVSKTGFTGPHVTGQAIDVQVSGHSAHTLITLALKHGFKGIGISQRGAHNKRFIHLDMLNNGPNSPRPWIWSY